MNRQREAEEAAGQSGAGASAGALISQASEAIECDLLWAFLRLLQATAHALDAVFQWIQTCPCHPPHIREQLQPYLGRYEHLRCPMKGLRAPELCGDSFLQHVDAALAINESELVTKFIRHLEASQQDLLIADWSKLAAFVKTSFRFKLSPWKSLPLLIVGLGHGSVSSARQLMWQALAQYEQLTDTQKETCHDLTRKVFSESLPMRAQLESFLRGQAISDLPELGRLRMEMMFIPILEQSIERRHAMLHQRIQSAHNHSGPYVSLVQRGSEIEALLSEPGRLQMLADLCASVRTPPLVIRGLGLQLHPQVAQWFQNVDVPEAQTPYHIVAALVYRCDLETQFRLLSVEVPSKPDDDSSHHGRLMEDVQGSSAGKEQIVEAKALTEEAEADGKRDKASSSVVEWSSAEEVWNDMLCRSAWDHFQAARQMCFSPCCLASVEQP